MVANGFQVTPEDISKFQTQATELATQIPTYASRYPAITGQPNFGNLQGFPAAQVLVDAYQNQLDNFVRAGSNLEHLGKQVSLLAQKAGSAAAGYQQTAIDENQASLSVGQTTGTGA